MFIQALQNSHLFLPASFAQRGVGVCPSLCVWGQTPPATRSLQGKASCHKAKQQNPPLLAARGCIHCFLCPQSALWVICTEISFLSLKATLRLHKTSAENSPSSPTLFSPLRVKPKVPYLLLVLYRWLHDLSAKSILSTFQAFHAEMNTWKNRIFASSVD